MIILHHDIFFFWLCVFLFTFIFIYLMESSGQKRGRISSVVEASSSASATPGDDDPRKNKVGRQDADGKDGFRSEPSASRTPPNPEVPSISLLKKQIKNVLRSCRNRKLPETKLEEIYRDLNLENASEEKRVKINQVLEGISRRRLSFLNNMKDKPHIDLIVKVHDWDRARNRNLLV
jgi:hypothetical protein